MLVGGSSRRSSSDTRSDFAIVRFNADGSLDTAFDGDGKVFTMIPPTAERASIDDLDVQTDGKILAAGSVSIIDTPGDDPDFIFAIARYNADGSLDTTFDGDGRTDFAVWRAGIYYVLQNSNSQAAYRYFGVANDIPVASAFTR